MTESKEGGASAKLDASHAKSGVVLGSEEDPVELPDLSAYEGRVRDIQRMILSLARDIPQGKKSVARNVKILKNRARMLLSIITTNEELRVHPETAVSGVEYTDDLQTPKWCSHESGGF